MIELSFHGATGTVTGSKYLLNVNGKRVLIDCGMFQGPRELRLLNWEKPAFKTTDIDSIILTHAHIDHIGFLPRLVKHGFKGKVYSTPPTADLAAISLMDTAHLQIEDAAYRTRKKISRHKKALPLFNKTDAERSIKLITPVSFGEEITVTPELRFVFRPAGHILGAAGVEINASDNGTPRRVLFSGDVGRFGNPLVLDPVPPSECDYLVCESTYGGRIHPPEDPYSMLEDSINDAVANKSVILIPAFAISRTQQITYLINDLIRQKRIPSIPIHIDSPMAISVTDIYRGYHELHRVGLDRIGGPECALDGKNISMHRDRNESKALNKVKGPAIIISASGMLSGGRILHHLINRLPDPSTTVITAGFMAGGTLGRKLLNGDEVVYIHKRPIRVKAKIVSIHGLSGHADSFELLHWLEPIKKAPRKVFVTHGEQSQSEAFVAYLKKERNWDCHIPVLGETVQL
ncbi:MAG: MBL fold metallo-hydrolase [candidate division Zixibacteria bacterium]